MLTFISPAETSPGTFSSLLREAYADYLAMHPERRDAMEKRWREGDDFAYADPKWSGGWLLFTKNNEEVIGFVCWDPRQKPTAVIGHNCIKPAFRGRGFGVAQMRHALTILKESGFTEAIVTTDDDPFFVPGQRMYQRCGFREIARMEVTDPFVGRLIKYQLDLRELVAD